MSLQDAIQELEKLQGNHVLPELLPILASFKLAQQEQKCHRCDEPIEVNSLSFHEKCLADYVTGQNFLAQQEQDALVAAAYRDEKQVKHMVDRFLGWRLPENFNPDGGISFEPLGNRGTEHEYKRQPVGTNVLDATQAEVMVRYMIDGMPSAVDARAALAAHDAEVRKEATSRVRVLLDNWIQLRDVKGDVTRLYAIGELENALNDLGQQASGKEEKS